MELRSLYDVTHNTAALRCEQSVDGYELRQGSLVLHTIRGAF